MTISILRRRLLFLLFSVLAPATATAWIATPCQLGEKPLERLLASNQHVFVARILTLSWTDPAVGVPGAEQIEYSSGSIKASFKVLSSIKGNPASLGALDQRLFGNPDSSPYLRVATDYLVFTNGSDILPNGCTSQVVRIQYNSFNDWRERMTSGNPDSRKYMPFRN